MVGGAGGIRWLVGQVESGGWWGRWNQVVGGSEESGGWWECGTQHGMLILNTYYIKYTQR